MALTKNDSTATYLSVAAYVIRIPLRLTALPQCPHPLALVAPMLLFLQLRTYAIEM